MAKDIKIFVSRRIDVNSVTVNNPLYVPVRCGASYDANKNSPYLGDDTGDNISEKRFLYSELTVQYWAWKNIEADYYGLCHYRRYFSFSDEALKPDISNMVRALTLDDKNIERFNLLDEKGMRRIIEGNDGLITKPERLNTASGKNTFRNVYELWDNATGYLFEKGTIERMFQLIHEMAPEYSRAADEYFKGDKHYGHICYIMKRELFDRLCQFQFPILEIIEREYCSPSFKRAPAYVGEMLLGIFIHHLRTYETWKLYEGQLVFFDNTEKFDNEFSCITHELVSRIRHFIWEMSIIVLPQGSKRRRNIKLFIKHISQLGETRNNGEKR